MSQKSSILNSELAVQILSAIASRTEGNYSTNLADELDKSQPSISRILTELHELGFIEKGKRGKVQYYQIDYNEIAEYWLQKLRDKLEEDHARYTPEDLDQHRNEAKELASNFFENFLKTNEISGMTVSRVLFNGFTYSLGYNLVEREDFLEENSFLKPVLEGLRIYTQEKGFSEDICQAMDESIEETLEN